MARKAKLKSVSRSKSIKWRKDHRDLVAIVSIVVAVAAVFLVYMVSEKNSGWTLAIYRYLRAGCV